MSNITADGVELTLWIGDRVQHIRHKHLKGYISGIEYNKPGVPSAIPYRIEWDSEDEARNLLGMFYFWATPEIVEKEEILR